MENIEVKSTAITTVFDAENQEWREITQKERIIATKLHDKLLEGAYFSAILITKIIDERHYLALGCESTEEYIHTKTPYSRRQAYVLLKIGRKFAGFIGNGTQNNLLLNESNNISVESALKDNESESAESALNGLGITKLLELTKLEDEEINELLSTGKASINNNQLTLEELKESSAKEVSKRIAEVKKQFSGKIALLTEENKQLKEEKKLLEKDAEKVKTAMELEKQYGAVASRLEDKEERLAQAEKMLNEFNEVVMRIGINENDPDVLKQRVVALIRQADGVLIRVQDEFSTLIDEQI